MELNAYEYAGLIIKHHESKHQNTYNLALSISAVAKKVAKWELELSYRLDYAIIPNNPEQVARVEREQNEARTKRQAYIIALGVLTEKVALIK